MSGGSVKVKKEENINSTAQRENRSAQQANCTGIPTQLKERIEQGTGISLDDVRVHYNSALPERLDALAYTRGNQVEIGPGQENCLPHELGHVVQQKLGLVRANAMHPSGVEMNTDAGLEQQADEIGAGKIINMAAMSSGSDVVQRRLFIRIRKEKINMTSEEVTQKLAEKQNNSKSNNEQEPKETPKKEAQAVNKDKSYVEISESFIPHIMQGYIKWLDANKKGYVYEQDNGKIEKNSTEFMTVLEGQIKKLITKAPVPSANPNKVYESKDPEKAEKNRVKRLPEGAEMEASYYFESLENFYEYIYFGMMDKENDPQNIKINVLNAGAGDSIVLTLPQGYLVVDLGNNLNFLLNYLALRKDKHGKSGDRGIPLIGDKTKIVITHNDADHKGCKSGYLHNAQTQNEDIEYILQNAVIGMTQYFGLNNEGKGKKGLTDQINQLLQNTGLLFYKMKNVDSKIKNSNDDSLVLYRRVDNDEAIFLCGDQEADLLCDMLLNLYESAPVKHMFIQPPHHGSIENNTPELTQMFTIFGNTADIAISSGDSYQHPSTGLYARQKSLLKQGTEVTYPGLLLPLPRKRENDIRKIIRGYMNNVKDKFMTSRIYAVKNVSADLHETTPGSVVYKSNGRKHVTFTKQYLPAAVPEAQTPEELEAKKIEESKAVQIMLTELGQQLGILPAAPAPDKSDSLLESGYNFSEIIGKLTEFVKQPEILRLKFYQMNELEQPQLLRALFQYSVAEFNAFLDGLDFTKLQIKSSDAWKDLFQAMWEQGICESKDIGKNVINILAIFLHDQEEVLIDKFMDGTRQELRDMAFRAAIAYSDDPLNCMRSYFDQDVNQIMIYSFLDGHTLFSNQIMSPSYKPEEAVDQLIRFLNTYGSLPLDELFKFVWYYLTCGSIASGVFSDVFISLAENAAELMDMLDQSHFQQLVELYPEHSSLLREYIEDVTIDENQLNYNGEGEIILDNECMTAVKLMSAPEMELEDMLKDSEITVDNLADYLEEKQEEMMSGTPYFIYFMETMPKNWLEIDIKNQKLFFRYAFGFLPDNDKYMIALISICEAYDIDCFFSYLAILNDLISGNEQNAAIFIAWLSNCFIERSMSKQFIAGCYKTLAVLKPHPQFHMIMFEEAPELFYKIMMGMPEDERALFVYGWTDDWDTKNIFYQWLFENHPMEFMMILTYYMQIDPEPFIDSINNIDPNILVRAFADMNSKQIFQCCHVIVGKVAAIDQQKGQQLAVEWKSILSDLLGSDIFN